MAQLLTKQPKTRSEANSPKSNKAPLSPAQALHPQPSAAPKSAREYTDYLLIFLTSILFSIYCFLAILNYNSPDGIVEREEFSIFVNSWLIIPPAALAVAWALGWMKRKLFGNSPFFLPFLFSINFLYILFSLGWLYQLTGQETGMDMRSAPSQSEIEPVCNALQMVIFNGLWVNLLCLPALLFPGWFEKIGIFNSRSLKRGLQLLAPVATLLFLRFFLSNGDSGFPTYILAVVLAMGCMVVHKIPDVSSKTARLAIDAAIAILVMMLVFEVTLFYDTHHYSFYLGPVNDYLHGRTPLVNVNCQYGVGVIFFLALIFKLGLLPFTYHAVAALLCVLTGLSYLIYYGILRAITRSLWISVVGVLMLIVINYYGTMSFAAGYPSIGPLRFGFPALVIGLHVCRRQWPRRPWGWLTLEGVVLGWASVWSMESLTYAFLPFAALVGYEIIARWDWRREALKPHLTRLGVAGVSILLAHTILAVHVRLRSGQWPHWNYYLDYVLLYTKSEYGTLLMKPWAPWAYYCLIYLGTLLAVAFKIFFFRKESYTDGAIVAALATAGVVELPYFVGRSHNNNLYHIAVPAVCLACYWMAWIHRQNRGLIPPLLRRTGAYIFCFAVILVTLHGWPSIHQKSAQSLVGWSLGLTPQPPTTGQPQFPMPKSLRQVFSAIWSNEDPDELTNEAVGLINKYFKDAPRVPLLITSNNAVHALVRTGKINYFALTTPTQDEIEPGSYQRKVNAPNDVKEGTIVIFGPSMQEMGAIQADIFNRLGNSFNPQTLEHTAHGLMAIQLTKR